MKSSGSKVSVAVLSVFSNSLLVVMKLIVGIMIGSVSVISEAVHSGVDLLASFIAWFAVSVSDKPADEDHPYGHGKFENVSGTLEAILIFVAAGMILWEAVEKLLHPRPMEETGWGVLVMLISSLANWIISNKLFRVARETGSVALEADGWHLRTDVYTSLGVMLGLGFIELGRIFFPGVNLGWIDPVAAIVVALMILHAAYTLTRQSAVDLLDISLPEEEIQWIQDLVCQHRSKLLGFHRLKTRKSGSARFVEFHLIFKPETSVAVSHEVGDDITAHIKEKFPETHVVIHSEPCDGSCQPHCIVGCFIPAAERPGNKI